MKVVIFGTGNFLLRRQYLLSPNIEIVAYIDNNETKTNTIFQGKKVYLPERIIDLSYDAILLASGTPKAMKEQLLQLGIESSRIYYWDRFICEQSRGVLQRKEVANRLLDEYKKSLLIIVPIINFAGGFMTAFYFGIVMKNYGYRVVISSPVVNEQAVKMINEAGIDVWQCPSILYMSVTEIEWIKQFDLVLCNSLQTIVCASMISKNVKTIFWLHEHSGQYEEILTQFGEYIDYDGLKQVQMLAVSNIAKKNFESHLHDYKVDVMPFGIQDCYIERVEENHRIRIILIASIHPLKNQMALVEAVKKITPLTDTEIECCFIGRDVNTAYRKLLDESVAGCSNIKILGEMEPAAVQNEIRKSDIIVCASTEETMSMTIVEGMMHGKICVTSSNTGVADYIIDGKNGFVFDVSIKNALSIKLKTVIDNELHWKEIQKEARQTFEKNFSLIVMKKNLLDILNAF